MRVYAQFIVLVSLFALCAPAHLSAQSNQSADAPPDVSFTIRFKNGKTRFYQGELITIEMLFASKTAGIYPLYGGTYDRSGRFEADKFHVDPANGVVDPTAEYFRSSVFGFFGGGLSPFGITLAEKPYVIERDINELVRFDQPGHYRLYVTNERVSRQVTARPRKLQSLTTTSNTIEFDVLPADAKLQEQIIREAAQRIKDSGGSARDDCRTLRFMNSAAAEAEMLQLYPSACAGEFQLGLVGSPRRSALIDVMEAQIGAPDYPVTSAFIGTLASLAFMNENPEPLPPYEPNDPEKVKTYLALAQKRRDAFQDTVTRYTRQVAATAARKTKSARAMTINTLLEFASGSRGAKFREDGAALDQLFASLPEMFFELPAERQYSLLSMYWKRIAGAAMLPVLRQIIAKPSPTSNPATDLHGIALKRLYQLSPEEGRRLVLQAMKTGPQRTRANLWHILPDAELPEVDQIVADELAKSPAGSEFQVVDEYSDLIARYASANSLARVKAAAAGRFEGKMNCQTQAALLAYFLRVDLEYGAAAFEQVLAYDRVTRGYPCGGLEDVGRQFMSPELEDIAIEHLADTNQGVAIQAIVLLRQKGSAKAEKPLLDRLGRWHAEWQARVAEVQPQIENGVVTGEPMQLELELVRALVSGMAWTLDADQLKQIEQLCLTPDGRSEVQNAIKARDDRTIHISLSLPDDFPVSITLGNSHPESIDQLKTKLSTMSKDSHFIWQSFSQDDEAEARLFEEVRSFLAKRGMTLERFEKQN